MMCAFTGPPKIYRFHGHGAVVMPNDAGFDALAASFDLSELGARCIVRVDVRDYLKENNALSIDGLPGITAEEGDAFAAPRE
jgi:hypothetical protein